MDALEVKNRLKSDYRSSVQKSGGSISADDLERVAVSDLVTYDKVMAEQKLLPPPKPPAEPRVNKAFAYAQERGIELFKNTRPSSDKTESHRDTILGARPRQYSEKFDKMVARIFDVIMIKESVNTSDPHRRTHSTETPALAREAINEILYYKMWNVGGRKNPYFMRPIADRARMFVRRLEDICDRSNAFYGPWWVK